MRPQPPIQQLNWEVQSLGTLSTLTDKGLLTKMNTSRSAAVRARQYQQPKQQHEPLPRSRSPVASTDRRMRPLTPRKQRSRAPHQGRLSSPESSSADRSAQEPVHHQQHHQQQKHPKQRVGRLFRNHNRKTTSTTTTISTPPRNSHTSGRQSPPEQPQQQQQQQMPKKSKRTVTTIKRTQKTRSELPRSSPKVTIPMEESRVYRSLSPQRPVPSPPYASSSPTMEPPVHTTTTMAYRYEPDNVATPSLFQPKSHKYRTESYKDRFREPIEPPFRPLGDYQVDMARVRSLNTPETSVLGPPDLHQKYDDNDVHDNVSEASSSIFADLEKEEESTIWGDLEQDPGKKGAGNPRTFAGRLFRRHRRRRVLSTSMDESERYGEIRLPPRMQSRGRTPVMDDIESMGGGITTVGDQAFFGEGEDAYSVCVFFQDLLTRDCPSFFQW